MGDIDSIIFPQQFMSLRQNALHAFGRAPGDPTAWNMEAAVGRWSTIGRVGVNATYECKR